MVPATTGQTVQPSRGTVFSAIVASDGSDTVELRATSVGMATLINGVHVELSTGLSHRFNSLTLFVEDSHRTGVLSASGINIQVTQQFGHIGAISVSISDRHTHNTRGLLGSYNDDPTDDLMPKTGSSSLPVNSTQEQVHYQFGLSCESCYHNIPIRKEKFLSLIAILVFKQIFYNANISICRSSSVQYNSRGIGTVNNQFITISIPAKQVEIQLSGVFFAMSIHLCFVSLAVST